MMKLLTHLVFIGYLLTGLATAQSRPGEAAEGSATISGRVTAEGKPLPGTTMILVRANDYRSNGRAESDSQGRYQFTGIVAGAYQILPLSRLYAFGSGVADRFFTRTITVIDGENVINVDLSLVLAGVVTGKVIDPEGKPVVEKIVELERIVGLHDSRQVQFYDGSHETDDRGVYRLFGLPPGRYRVSCCGRWFAEKYKGKSYPHTFHPDVTEASQATIVEVVSGGEAAGVDIRLNPPFETYSITGRVVDAENGKPVTGLMIFHGPLGPQGRMEQMIGANLSDANGEFRIEGLRSGRYGVHAGRSPRAQGGVSGYSDQVRVDLGNENVTGVDLLVKPAGSISGAVVIEGPADPTDLTQLRQQMVNLHVRAEGFRTIGTKLAIGVDGSFRADGLNSGQATFSHTADDGMAGNLRLIRVERDGLRVREIEIESGLQVTGVRLVFGYANGVLRGRVVISGGSLPESSAIHVRPRRTDEPLGARQVQADARGFFIVEGLVAGEYEVEAMVVFGGTVPPEFRRRTPTTKQSVTVMNGQTSQVTLTINLTQ